MVNRFKIRIANRICEIETLHIRSMAICRSFITNDPPELTVCIRQQDIDQERAQYEEIYGECTLWDGALEVLALHRLLSEKLIEYNTLMMHGAAVAYQDKAYLFTAPSGTGKTTHILQWLKHLPDAFVVNGDKPFIGMNHPPMVYGSPWAGKESLYNNTSVPLKAIVLLERAPINHICRISFSDAFPALYKQIYRPENPELMRKTLRMLKGLNDTVLFYRFQCNNFREDCFDTAYNALVRDTDVHK